VLLPRKWPAELATRWKVDLGEGCGSPAVVGARVFVLEQQGPREVVRCLDTAAGRSLWQHAYPARYHSGLARTGPRNTPAVDGKRVYTVGATGEMYCLNRDDGKVVWHVSFSKAFQFRRPAYGYSASPLIDGDRVIVQPGGRGGDSVVALDKRTGKVLWKSQSDGAGYASPMILPAAPARGPRQLVVFTREGVISLDPDGGALHWRLPWTTSYEQNIAQPMLGGVGGDRLFVTSLTGLVALQLATRGGRPAFRELWRNRNMAVHFSCPVVHGQHMYGCHGRREELRCVALADGAVRWTQPLPANGRAGIVLADGLLLVYTDTGRLIVADADPAAYRQRADYALAGGNWSSPVLAGGCLYLRDFQSLRCVQLPKR
jgi:outer membrane protein assembly factor BamB